MRRLKSALLVLSTLLLVAAGAAMPGAVGYIQDAYGAGRQESRSFDSFSLTLRQDSETARLLRRLARGDYWMEEAVDWSEQPVQPTHTARQAADAAMEALAWMAKCGVIESGALEDMGTPQVTASIIKTDSNLSWQEGAGDSDTSAQASLGVDPETEIETVAIAWDCWWPEIESDRAGPMVRIDDGTEKLLMAMVPTPREGKSVDLDYQAECWRKFLEDHYGFAVVNTAEYLYDDGDARYSFHLDPEDGEGVLRMGVDFDTFDDGCPRTFLWPAQSHDF